MSLGKWPQRLPASTAAKPRRMLRLLVLMLALPGAARATGVAFNTISLPRQMRQEGLAETAGEVQLTATNNGTIRAGSAIDIIFSSAVVNNTQIGSNLGLGNLFVNGITCTAPNTPAGCPNSLSLLGSSTIRLAYSADQNFQAGGTLNLAKIRVNANAAIGVGSVTVTFTGFSSDPTNNPITYSDPQRQVGVLNSTMSVAFNHSSATPNPVKQFFTCNFPDDNVNDMFVRVTEVFPGAFTSQAFEHALSNVPPPTNGVVIAVTFTNVPAGLTLSATGTQLASGSLAFAPATPATTVAQTVSGTPITFFHAVSAAENSLLETSTLNYSLKPTSGSPIPDVVSPINIQATVQITPITQTDTIMPRFVNNQLGPVTVANIANCPPPRAKGPQLVSD